MRTSQQFSATSARLLGKALHSGDADVQQLAARLVLRFFRLSPNPTQAPPGSNAKIAVMTKRVADGYSPFHPLDLRPDRLPDGAGLAVPVWRKQALPRVLGVKWLQGEAQG
jgi:hypothetical protein